MNALSKKANKAKTEMNFKEDFPILNSGIVYLDNAATTQKPKIVIDRLIKFYEEENANPRVGSYVLSESVSANLDDARGTFANLINAQITEIIFTRNATDSFNLLADSLALILSKRDNIVTTEIEHHSNYVPWQQIAKRTGAQLRVAQYNPDKENLRISELVDSNTKIVALTLMSNVTGFVPDVEEIISAIKKKNKNVIIVADGTQAVAHQKIDVKKLNIDFLCFSAHKIYGPTGVGILYGRAELLKKMEPSRFGGGMIKHVSLADSTWADIPEMFEPGTINAEGIIASAEAVKYMTSKNISMLFKKEKELKKYALGKLRQIKGVMIIGHKSANDGPVISFLLEGIHPHDIASICARKNVCVRAGHHCAQMFHRRLGIPASTRISLSFYNEKEDIDKLVECINDAINIFKVQKLNNIHKVK
jgi:cysteine desulfurase / selenocysteine lyase